jgi:hypothetical protein
MAIELFNHMVAEGVECDAVTCCSLITALDKGGQWQLAEQVAARAARQRIVWLWVGQGVTGAAHTSADEWTGLFSG